MELSRAVFPGITFGPMMGNAVSIRHELANAAVARCFSRRQVSLALNSIFQTHPGRSVIAGAGFATHPCVHTGIDQLGFERSV